MTYQFAAFPGHLRRTYAGEMKPPTYTRSEQVAFEAATNPDGTLGIMMDSLIEELEQLARNDSRASTVAA